MTDRRPLEKPNWEPCAWTKSAMPKPYRPMKKHVRASRDWFRDEWSSFRPVPPDLTIGEVLARATADRRAADRRQLALVGAATWTGPEVADFYSLAPDIERVWLNVDTGQRAPFARMRRNVARVLKLRRLLKESRPAAVLSFIDVPNVLTILGSLGLPVRVVVSERNDLRRPNGQGEHVGAYPLSRPWRILRRLVYRWADGVTALHQDAAQWVCAECGVAAEVIPNPLRELPDRDLWERELEDFHPLLFPA